MIPRLLEPEVMDSPEEARDYDAMDHRAVNNAFVADLLGRLRSTKTKRDAGSRRPVRILDVGTGTALIPIALAQQYRSALITASDLSTEMLKLAQRNVESAGLTDRVSVQISDGKSLSFADGSFDVVISNSIIHHLPEPVTPLARCCESSDRAVCSLCVTFSDHKRKATSIILSRRTRPARRRTPARCSEIRFTLP